MRRSMLFALASVIALGLTACDKDSTLTAPPAAANHISSGPIQIPPRTKPDPNAFAAITAGDNFTCAVKNSGKVFCWGINDNFESGRVNGATCASGKVCVSKPTVVLKASLDTLLARQVDAGQLHTCAIDFNENAWCWGDGDQGQLGRAQGLLGPSVPTEVTGGLQFESIGAGGESTCGIAATGVYCWGFMNGGTMPVWVAPTADYSGIVVGNQHACLLEQTNPGTAVDCWGVNGSGQLANPVSVSAAFSVRAGFGNSVLDVATEGLFTCADQSNGTVQCAGDNTWGELGISWTSTPTSTPQTVGGNILRPGWQTLHGVTVGSSHACALDQSNYAWCWGNNNWGQIGNGVTTGGGISPAPNAVVGGHTFRALAAGYTHTCGIGTDNHIYCWGENSNGELGANYWGGWFGYPVQAIDP